MTVVFGGSFNPPTIAHKLIAIKVIETFKVDNFVFLPVGDDYEKSELVSVKHRLKMLKLLTCDMKNVVISDLEANNKYGGTLNALNELSKSYKDIHFLIGADQLNGLKTWIKYDELLRKYPFIVITRSGYETNSQLLKDYPNTFTFVKMDFEGSSSMIRNNLDPKKELTTNDIYDYITANKLYKKENHV